MTWYVLYTKPRNEKKVAATLADMGIEVYCPIREEVKQWSDRKKKIQTPVFTSYIFVRLADYQKDSVAVLELNGAVKFLWWNGKPGVVREAEIQAIQDFLTQYKDAELSIQLREGETVQVQEGPLAESEGKVIRVEGNTAVLHLHTLGVNLIAKLPIQSVRSIKK